MNIEVKIFGPQARLAQRSSIRIALEPAATCEALRAKLAEAEPELAPSLPRSRFAINHEFAAESQAIREGDEVALIGMVSGG